VLIVTRYRPGNASDSDNTSEHVYVHFHLSSWIGRRCADGCSVASYRAFADGALEYRDLTKANDDTAEMQASRYFRDWLAGDHVPARALRDQSRKS